MRPFLLALLVVLLLGVPGAVAEPLVPDDLVQRQNAQSPEQVMEAVRNAVKQLFPESAPFAPNCISHQTESYSPDLAKPADAGHKVTEETVTFYVLVYDTLARVTIEASCLRSVPQS